MTQKPRHRATVPISLALILALAAALRVWGMSYGIPNSMARPDEEIIVNFGFQIVATGHLDLRFFDYPSFPMYLSALAMGTYYELGRATGHYGKVFDFLYDSVVLRPGLHFWIARMVNIILGVATVAATYWLGKSVADRRRVGLVAAAAMATCYLHVIYSRFATVDVTMTFFVTMAVLFAVRAARWERWADYVLSGAMAGLAAASKYNAGLVILGLCLPTATALTRTAGASARLRLLAKLAAAGLASLASFALTSPYILVHYQTTASQLSTLTEVLHSIHGERALWIHLRTTLPVGMGVALYAAALAGTARALWLRRPADQAILGFSLPFFALVASVTLVYPRYVIPLLPLGCVLASDTALTAFRRWERISLPLVTAVFTLPGLCHSVQFDTIASRKDTRILASEWVSENLPKRSPITVCDGYGAPEINADRRRPPAFEPRLVVCDVETVQGTGARFVVTHEHPYLRRFSSVDDSLREFLESRAHVLARFDPFRDGSHPKPYFYPRDAFYIPFTGLDAVERGGPILTIWELDAPAREAEPGAADPHG